MHAISGWVVSISAYRLATSGEKISANMSYLFHQGNSDYEDYNEPVDDYYDSEEDTEEASENENEVPRNFDQPVEIKEQ